MTDERAPIDETALRDRLVPPWRHLEVLQETGSTNGDLSARAAAGVDIRGMVLLAEHQTAGRGRHGRTWSAAPRSQVLISVGVDVAGMPTSTWGWLPLVTGIAVVEALAEVAGIDAGLKWPNDVLVGDDKLAGILAEVAAPSLTVVVGLGLNVTTTTIEVPGPATSLSQLGAAVTDRTAITSILLERLGSWFNRWRMSADPLAGVGPAYYAHSVTIGRRVRATLPGGRAVTGTADSLDGLGRLRIDTGPELVTVSAADIEHLRLIC